MNGVYVVGIFENGAADAAGIKEGDVITKVGSVEVNKVPELQEQISQFRPGDEVVITLNREGKELEKKMILKNIDGNTELVRREDKDLINVLGASFDNVSTDEQKKLNINGGAKISRIWSGKLMSAGVQEGFIITRIDRQPVNDKNDVKKYLEGKKGGVLIEGIYPNGKERYYGFGME